MLGKNKRDLERFKSQIQLKTTPTNLTHVQDEDKKKLRDNSAERYREMTENIVHAFEMRDCSQKGQYKLMLYMQVGDGCLCALMQCLGGANIIPTLCILIAEGCQEALGSKTTGYEIEGYKSV